MPDSAGKMADDGTAELEDRLRDVGERLHAPPDDAEDLLKLLNVSLLSSPCACSYLVSFITIHRVCLCGLGSVNRRLVCMSGNAGGFCALTFWTIAWIADGMLSGW